MCVIHLQPVITTDSQLFQCSQSCNKQMSRFVYRFWSKYLAKWICCVFERIWYFLGSMTGRSVTSFWPMQKMCHLAWTLVLLCLYSGHSNILKTPMIGSHLLSQLQWALFCRGTGGIDRIIGRMTSSTSTDLYLNRHDVDASEFDVLPCLWGCIL